MAKSLMWKPTVPPFREYKKELLKKQTLVTDFIYQIGESPQLRKSSSPVPLEKLHTKEYQEKMQYMKKCLRAYREVTGKGRAIAAVQLGFAEQMIVIYMPEKKDPFYIIINPVITKSSQQLLRYPEMCMSASPAIAPVIRPSWIEFTYYDEQGKKQVWQTKAHTKLGKMYNRVFQHEIDHLSGVICIDKVKSKDIIFESDPAYYKNASFEKETSKEKNQ